MQREERFLSIQIRNATILTPFAQQEGTVLVDGDQILDVTRTPDSGKRVKTIDAKGMYLVPGYIDLRVNGGKAATVSEATPEAVLAICEDHGFHGTTTLLPTAGSAPMADIARMIDAVKAAKAAKCDTTIAGVHVTNVTDQAVQSRKAKGEPDLGAWKALLERWDGVRIVGAAPEMPGALALGDLLREKRIVASIADSQAGYEQVLSAVSHGYSDISQFYCQNSTLTEHNGFRVPGVTECGLAMDELTVQVVADGWQLPLLLLQIIFRCKGAENMILVSDAGGATPSAKLDDRFATMALLVRLMVAAGISLRVALRMATVNPARRIGLDGSKGRIAAGYDADLIMLDNGLNVRFVMAGGKIIRNDLEG